MPDWLQNVHEQFPATRSLSVPSISSPAAPKPATSGNADNMFETMYGQTNDKVERKQNASNKAREVLDTFEQSQKAQSSTAPRSTNVPARNSAYVSAKPTRPSPKECLNLMEDAKNAFSQSGGDEYDRNQAICDFMAYSMEYMSKTNSFAVALRERVAKLEESNEELHSRLNISVERNMSFEKRINSLSAENSAMKDQIAAAQIVINDINLDAKIMHNQLASLHDKPVPKSVKDQEKTRYCDEPDRAQTELNIFEQQYAHEHNLQIERERNAKAVAEKAVRERLRLEFEDQKYALQIEEAERKAFEHDRQLAYQTEQSERAAIMPAPTSAVVTTAAPMRPTFSMPAFGREQPTTGFFPQMPQQPIQMPQMTGFKQKVARETRSYDNGMVASVQIESVTHKVLGAPERAKPSGRQTACIMRSPPCEVCDDFTSLKQWCDDHDLNIKDYLDYLM